MAAAAAAAAAAALASAPVVPAPELLLLWPWLLLLPGGPEFGDDDLSKHTGLNESSWNTCSWLSEVLFIWEFIIPITWWWVIVRKGEVYWENLNSQKNLVVNFKSKKRNPNLRSRRPTSRLEGVRYYWKGEGGPWNDDVEFTHRHSHNVTPATSLANSTMTHAHDGPGGKFDESKVLHLIMKISPISCLW